jgi:hypothetical protein
MKTKSFVGLILLLSGAAALEARKPPATKTDSASQLRILAYKNGRWFSGKGFSQAKTMYSVNGILRPNRPFTVDKEIDLNGMYVLPVCGEAHNHNATGDNDTAIDGYIGSGILYVKNPTNLPRGRQGSRINSPNGIDVIFSNGNVTAPGGHPLGLVKRNIERGAMTAEDGEGAFYYTVDSLRDVDEKLPQLFATNPDFVKTTLVYSEEYDKRKNDDKYFSRRGLDPALLGPIAARAHQAGLRVATHVESAHDFHVAVEAGVDEINHMPGFWPSEEAVARQDFARYRIAEADARNAGKRHIAVVSTLVEALEHAKAGKDPAAREAFLELYGANINLLKKHRVPILIGSDQFRRNSQAEVLALAEAGLMSNLEIIQSWCEATPQAIFPRRRIGGLKDGYEANFVVLGADPLQEMNAVKDVRMVFKGGEQLKPLPKAGGL